jgi:CDP-diacylglycerol--glycerol-3-phosphate 3-phosphatidyltransferase
MKIYIPRILLYSRLVFTFVIVLTTLSAFSYAKAIVLFLMYIGIMTDIFDGVIARKLGISNDNFRVQDTVFDLLFYFSILFFIISINPQAFAKNKLQISVIIALEAFMYFVSLVRFGKLPSPHAILSKLWGIYLVIEFTVLIIGVTGSHFTVALIFGTIVHSDRLLIYLIIRQWDHDIPSCYHALLLRQGKMIKRNEIFNG